MAATAAPKPKFWEEDWLSIPMGELDIRNMSPEKYLAYQYWLVHEAEAKRREEELKEEGKIETIKDLIKEGTISFKGLVETRKYSKETIELVNSTLALSRTVSHAFGLVARFALIATLEKRTKRGFLRSERVFLEENLLIFF